MATWCTGALQMQWQFIMCLPRLALHIRLEMWLHRWSIAEKNQMCCIDWCLMCHPMLSNWRLCNRIFSICAKWALTASHMPTIIFSDIQKEPLSLLNNDEVQRCVLPVLANAATHVVSDKMQKSRSYRNLYIPWRLFVKQDLDCSRNSWFGYASMATLSNSKHSIQSLAHRTRPGGMREAIKF